MAHEPYPAWSATRRTCPADTLSGRDNIGSFHRVASKTSLGYRINYVLPCRIVTLRPSQAASLTAWAPVASSSYTPTRGANTRARNKLASSSFQAYTPTRSKPSGRPSSLSTLAGESSSMCSKSGAYSGLPETEVTSPSILTGTSPSGGRKPMVPVLLA